MPESLKDAAAESTTSGDHGFAQEADWFLPPVFDPMETFLSFILELQESSSSVALVPAVGALNSFANGS